MSQFERSSRLPSLLRWLTVVVGCMAECLAGLLPDCTAF